MYSHEKTFQPGGRKSQFKFVDRSSTSTARLLRPVNLTPSAGVALKAVGAIGAVGAVGAGSNERQPCAADRHLPHSSVSTSTGVAMLEAVVVALLFLLRLLRLLLLLLLLLLGWSRRSMWPIGSSPRKSSSSSE